MNALTDFRDWLESQLHSAQHAVGLQDGLTFQPVIAEAFARARSIGITRPLLPLPTSGNGNAQQAVTDLSQLHQWVCIVLNDRVEIRSVWAAFEPGNLNELGSAFAAAEDNYGDFQFLIAAYDTKDSGYSIASGDPDPARLLGGHGYTGGGIDVCAKTINDRVWRFVAIRHMSLKAEDACDHFKCLARSAGKLLPSSKMNELGVVSTIDPIANWLAYLLLGKTTEIEHAGQHRAIKHPYMASVVASRRAAALTAGPPYEPLPAIVSPVPVAFPDDATITQVRNIVAQIRGFPNDPRMKRSTDAFGFQDVVTDAGRALLAAKRFGALIGDIELYERIESVEKGERQYQQSQQDRGTIPKPIPWQVWVAAVRLLWYRKGQPYGEMPFSSREILDGCPLVAHYLEQVIDNSTIAQPDRASSASPAIEPKDLRLPDLKPWAMEAWRARQAGAMVTEIADQLSRKYSDPRITQPRVSEQIQRARQHAEASGLAAIASTISTVSTPTVPARTLDPMTADMGKRTDGRSTHLREKAKQIAEEE